jgi:DNA-binding LacI/PurR family transcriptional regulator
LQCQRQTVSRVLYNNLDVSDAMRKRILDVIEQAAIFPKLRAKSRMQQLDTIALVGTRRLQSVLYGIIKGASRRRFSGADIRWRCIRSTRKTTN